MDAAHFWGWGSDAFIGNYGDNSLLYFFQYQNSLPGSPLYEGALTGTNISAGGTLFDMFRADVMGNRSRGLLHLKPTANTATGLRILARGMCRRCWMR